MMVDVADKWLRRGLETGSFPAERGIKIALFHNLWYDACMALKDLAPSSPAWQVAFDRFFKRIYTQAGRDNWDANDHPDLLEHALAAVRPPPITSASASEGMQIERGPGDNEEQTTAD